MPEEDWQAYLDAFHRDEAGVTEEIMVRALDAEGHDAYDWIAAQVPAGARVLDLACGSAPLAARLPVRGYTGVDRSGAELGVARRRAPGARFVQADADRLVGVEPVDVVACSMGLRLLQPLPAVLAAAAGVLLPGGRLVATLPSTKALSVTDRLAWLGIVAALRARPSFPNDDLLDDLDGLLAAAGLEVLADEHARYALALRDARDGERLIASLYLPGVDPRRRAAAAALLGRAGPSELGLSLRRIIATAR